jgi:hypothetical protein
MAERFVLDDAEIEHRFGYHRADQAAAVHYAGIRDAYKQLAKVVVESTPPGREQSLAMTALQESLMWTNAAYAMTTPIAPDPREVTR